MYIGDPYTRAVQNNNNIVLFLRIIILYILVSNCKYAPGEEKWEKRARNYGGNTGVGIGGVGGGEGRAGYIYVYTQVYIYTHTTIQ